MKRFYHYKTTLLFISLAMSLSILFGFSMVRNISIETPIRIEDFTSMTQDQLLAWSKENDIKIVTIEEYNDELEVGKVVSQDVIVGERLFAGSSIKVIVSKGPNPDVIVNLIDFKGKDIGEIQQFIENNKLLAATIEFEKSTEINSAYFIRTDSQSNSIKRGQSIKFYISTGSKEELTTIIVPDFKEYTRQQISSWGQTNNIKTNFVEEFNNDILVGKVISQSQAPNSSVYDGSSITLKMSLGAGVVLENLVGKSKTTIDKFINDNGLKVNYTYTYSSTQNKDLGISMNPSASTKVGNGSTINVTLSLGKISITDFKGKSLSDLQAWVNEVNKQGANLKVTSTQAYSDTITSGLIITQTPSSGDINPGSEIKASISRGAAIIVENYLGKTVTTVQSGLKLNKAYEYSDQATGIVIKQSLPADKPVDKDSTITLTYSKGKPNINSFVGKSPNELQTFINGLNAEGANLKLTKLADEYDNSTNIEKGKIKTQTVSSGTVNVGSTISYVVSKGRSVNVPNYVGSPAPSSSEGITIKSTSEHNSNYANGIVFYQSVSGTQDYGVTVNIKISLGPVVVKTMQLPALSLIVGNSSSGVQNTISILTNWFNSESDTKVKFTNYSFSTTPRPSGCNDCVGDVASQTPEPGTTVNSSSAIHVVIYE